MRRAALIWLLVATTASAQRPATDVVLVPERSTASAIAEFKNLQNDVARARDPTVVVDLPESRADVNIFRSARPSLVKVRPTASTVESTAVPLFFSRIKKAEGDIAKLIEREPQSSPSFLKGLRDQFQQSNTPYLAIDPVAVPDVSTAAVVAHSSGGQLDMGDSLPVALLRARSKGFPVKASELQVLPSAGRLTDTATAAFMHQYNMALDTLTATLRDPTTSNQKAFADNAALTRQQFINIWPTLRNDAAKRMDAVRRLAGLEQQSALKAVYALPSNFTPASYSSIYDQSLRTVALYERDEQFCSGYLVSAEWVMTAGHCLKRGDIQGMKVSVSVPPCPDGSVIQPTETCAAPTPANPASPVAGPVPINPAANLPTTLVPVDNKWPNTGTGLDDSDPIDFVFLHVAATPEFERAWKRIELRAPLCLSTTPLGYEQAAFVIAYQPGSALKVYDHAYVWFPFQVGPQNFQALSAMTGAKLERLAEALSTDPATQLDFFNKNMTSFENAYQLNGAMREYRTERAGFGKRPYFGMDTDTYQGNSGAPVFSRTGVCVVGVFSGGAMENAQMDESTWKEHEFAMPLSEVDKYVRTLDPAAGNPTSEELAARQALLALLPQ